MNKSDGTRNDGGVTEKWNKQHIFDESDDEDC